MKHLILLLTLFALMLAPLAAQAQEPAELEVPPVWTITLMPA